MGCWNNGLKSGLTLCRQFIMLRTILFLHAVVKNVNRNIIELVMLFLCFSRKFFCHVLIETTAEIMLKQSDWLSQCLTRRCDPFLSLSFFGS